MQFWMMEDIAYLQNGKGKIVLWVILVGWYTSQHGEVIEMKVLRFMQLLSNQEAQIEEPIFLSEIVMT